MKSITKASERLSMEIGRGISTPAHVGAILLLGPPGVGKGTQARELSKLWGVPHVSTGELLRDNVTKGTRIGRIVKEILNCGDLVPDSLVKEMVETRLLEIDTARGYILDGFPRTLDQAIWLTDTAGTFSKGLAFLAVSIQLSRCQLVRRITGRRYCPLCQATFNIYENPPKIDGLCDVDTNALIQRADDSEAILNRRLDVYDRLASPVIKHFREHGKFVEVSGDGPIEWITARIVGARQWHVASQINDCELLPRIISEER